MILLGIKRIRNLFNVKSSSELRETTGVVSDSDVSNETGVGMHFLELDKGFDLEGLDGGDGVVFSLDL